MLFPVLLAGASAQIQIGSNALTPSEPTSNAEHRRLLSTTYPNVDFQLTVSGSNWQSGAETLYLLNSNNPQTLYFYIYETNHYPTRGLNFFVRCDFTAPGQVETSGTTAAGTSPTSSGIVLPLVRYVYPSTPSPLSLSPLP